MAAVTRQPFAQLDGARLQNLTSIKNRQNGMLLAVDQSTITSMVTTRDNLADRDYL
jgi:hypothetical protein